METSNFNNNLKIGENIMRQRKKKGFTQKQLASAIGISQSSMSKYETGVLQISAETIIQFANALKVNFNTILGTQNDESFSYSPSLKIMRRLKKIENMSPSDQKALLKTIDKYIQSL